MPVTPTGVGLAVDGQDVELPYQCADMLAADFMAFELEQVAQHSRAGKGMFQRCSSSIRRINRRSLSDVSRRGEHARGVLKQLRLPLRNLIRMNVKFLRKCGQCLITLEGG